MATGLVIFYNFKRRFGVNLSLNKKPENSGPGQAPGRQFIQKENPIVRAEFFDKLPPLFIAQRGK
jgi:hypothetical protein